MAIASTNSTMCVLFERQLTVTGYAAYLSFSDECYRYSGHQDASGSVEFRDSLSYARSCSFCLVIAQMQVVPDVSTGHSVSNE